LLAHLTATEARKNFFDLIKNSNAHHQTYHIHHPKGAAVLLSEEDYESLIETLELLSIPGFRESMKASVKQVREKKVFSMDDIFKEDT
jgi:antitoxin YefM